MVTSWFLLLVLSLAMNDAVVRGAFSVTRLSLPYRLKTYIAWSQRNKERRLADNPDSFQRFLDNVRLYFREMTSPNNPGHSQNRVQNTRQKNIENANPHRDLGYSMSLYGVATKRDWKFIRGNNNMKQQSHRNEDMIGAKYEKEWDRPIKTARGSDFRAENRFDNGVGSGFESGVKYGQGNRAKIVGRNRRYRDDIMENPRNVFVNIIDEGRSDDDDKTEFGAKTPRNMCRKSRRNGNGDHLGTGMKRNGNGLPTSKKWFPQFMYGGGRLSVFPGLRFLRKRRFATEGFDGNLRRVTKDDKAVNDNDDDGDFNVASIDDVRARRAPKTSQIYKRLNTVDSNDVIVDVDDKLGSKSNKIKERLDLSRTTRNNINQPDQISIKTGQFDFKTAHNKPFDYATLDKRFDHTAFNKRFDFTPILRYLKTMSRRRYCPVVYRGYRPIRICRTVMTPPTRRPKPIRKPSLYKTIGKPSMHMLGGAFGKRSLYKTIGGPSMHMLGGAFGKRVQEDVTS